MDQFPELVIHWKKPAGTPFPRIWKEYETKRKDGSIVKIKIQDAPPERYADVVDFMCTYYLRDEPLCSSSKILEDEVSVAVYRYVFTKALEENMSLVAFVEDEKSGKPIIVGAQILTVYSKDDPSLPEVPGAVTRKMINMYYAIRAEINIFEALKTDEYLHEWGLCVHPDYRGLKIGYNILASLQPLCLAINVKGTMIMFTSKYSQTSANELGYKVYNEIVYADYKNAEGVVVFPVTDTKSVKLMGTTFF